MGPVELKLREKVKSHPVVLALIDPANLTPNEAAEKARKAEECGVEAILVGGSTAVDQLTLDQMVRELKSSISIPVILFPGNITGISPNADAILFISLLNSENPYFIIEAQALGALIIRRYGLEAIPTGYIVVGEGGSIGFIGKARGTPPEKPDLTAMYALAAKYMGMRLVYLEAGSGVTSHIPQAVIRAVREVFDGMLMVGGGLRSPEDAEEVALAGADLIVVGTLIEREGFEPILRRIVDKVVNVRGEAKA